jgi:formate dehydrogenase subunit beta
MRALTNRIREVAKAFLEQKEVDLVIGFAQGTVPLRSTPCFVRQEDEIERLTWNSFCENNLAHYLVRRQERVAVVAKGCDVCSIVELIKENQIARDQVVIIGIPCEGMIDRRLVETDLGEREILEVEEHDNEFVIKGADFDVSLDRNAFLYPSCKVCSHKSPILYDVLLGDAAREIETDSYQDVGEFEAQSSDERWEYLSREFSKCIRCYACRNACPLCYCQECFVESSQPQWIGKTTEKTDMAIFHLMRAFHLVGRCVECGACERACPMGVDIRKLNRKMAKDVKQLFGYHVGMSLEHVNPLATYDPNDPEEFMFNP